MKTITGTTIVFALAYAAAAVAQTEVPNTFQAGQPARAAEVNANFDALEAAIDQLQGPQDAPRPRLVVIDSTGTLVGPFLQSLNDSDQLPTAGIVYVDAGGRFLPLAIYKTHIGWHPTITVWFDNIGCQGTAYATGAGSDGLVPISNFVVLPDGITVAEIDFPNTVDGSIAQSRMGSDGQCANRGQPESGAMSPLIQIGTLPASSPPYSITSQ